MLVIRKKGTKNFTHEYASFPIYSSSDITLVFSGDFMKVRSDNGRIIFLKDGFRYTDVTVYDDTASGTPEVFSSITALQQRLINLGHPAYVEEGDVEWGDINGDINNQTDLIELIDSISGGTPQEKNPVENVYEDIDELLANQASQTESYFQVVEDATADPTVTGPGEVYYEKLVTSTASLGDYRKLSDEETTIVQGNRGWYVFRVSERQDDSTPLTSVARNRIGLEYNNTSELYTSLFFNERYTDTIESLVTSSYTFKIRLYNQTKRKLYVVDVTGFTTVNTDYTRAAITSTIPLSEIELDDRLEVLFDVDTSTGSGGIPDAPADGNIYGRQNNAWTQVTGGGGGITLGGEWRYDDDTNATEPNSGRFKFNNAAPSLSTEIYLSGTTRNGDDANFIINTFKQGDKIYIQNPDDSNERLGVEITSITDNTGWFTFSVTVLESGSDDNWSTSIFTSYNFVFLVNTSSGGADLTKDVNQAHTFTVGTPVRLNGGTYEAAAASDEATANAISIVIAVADANNFTIQSESYVDPAIDFGLTNGDEVWLGQSGGLTTTEPSDGEWNVFIGQQTPQGLLLMIQQGFLVESGGGSGGISDVPSFSVVFKGGASGNPSANGEFHTNSTSSVAVNELKLYKTDVNGKDISVVVDNMLRDNGDGFYFDDGNGNVFLFVVDNGFIDNGTYYTFDGFLTGNNFTLTLDQEFTATYLPYVNTTGGGGNPFNYITETGDPSGSPSTLNMAFGDQSNTGNSYIQLFDGPNATDRAIDIISNGVYVRAADSSSGLSVQSTTSPSPLGASLYSLKRVEVGDNNTFEKQFIRVDPQEDEVTLQNYTQGQIDAAPDNSLVTKEWVLANSGGDTPEEQEIVGTIVTDAAVTTSKNIDWSAGSMLRFTMTGDTTFSDTNLPSQGKTQVLQMVLTGAFVATFPTGWLGSPKNDAYDGAKDNLITATITRNDGTLQVYYSLENMS